MESIACKQRPPSAAPPPGSAPAPGIRPSFFPFHLFPEVHLEVAGARLSTRGAAVSAPAEQSVGGVECGARSQAEDARNDVLVVQLTARVQQPLRTNGSSEVGFENECARLRRLDGRFSWHETQRERDNQVCMGGCHACASSVSAGAWDLHTVSHPTRGGDGTAICPCNSHANKCPNISRGHVSESVACQGPVSSSHKLLPQPDPRH